MVIPCRTELVWEPTDRISNAAAALEVRDLVPIRPATPPLVATRAVANAQTGELPSMVTKYKVL